METISIDLSKRYTFADYLGWMDDKRRELINGFVSMMTPAPSTKHQQILSGIHGVLWNLLLNHQCQVFPAPFDVRFPSKEGEQRDDKIYTVVQPDICMVCDPSKLDERGCIGAPDLIVEILSHASVKKDVEEKYKLYEENGVREYWIVHPNDETLSVFVLKNGKYEHRGIFTHGSKVIIHSLGGRMSVDLDYVFKGSDK
jgi:Uma2 family endonuclease